MTILPKNNDINNDIDNIGNNINSNDNSKLFYFRGCAWGCAYYIGVYQKLIQHYSENELKSFLWGGSSAGCFISLAIVLGKNIEDMKEMYFSLSNVARKYGVMGKMSIYHEYALSKWLPDDGDEFKTANNKLFICVTKWFNKAELISNWSSNRELKDIIHGSCHIPFYMTHIEKVNNHHFIDGSFSEENIIYKKNNIKVISCISEEADIRPNKLYGYSECFSPPNKCKILSNIEEGFLDAEGFINSEHYLKEKTENIESFQGTHKIQHQHKTENFTLVLILCWILRFLEEIDFYKVIISLFLIYYFFC